MTGAPPSRRHIRRSKSANINRIDRLSAIAAGTAALQSEIARTTMKRILVILSLIVFAAFAAACQNTADNPAVAAATAEQTNFESVSPTDAKTAIEKGGAQFIDVRTESEYAGGHAAKAVNIPLDRLPESLGKLDKSTPVYVICQTGRRSAQGSKILKEAGFGQVFNVSGGTSEWTAAGLPIEK